MSSPRRRVETDVMKLLMSDYDVKLVNDNIRKLQVIFHGPKETPYENGVWQVYVQLPEQYPYKSPSIGFMNRIFHPNIDETSGTVCLDVINQTWSPMFDLINIFEIFLPQLLRYANATDPLNQNAATLLLNDKNTYNERIKEYVQTYASSTSALQRQGDDHDDESDMSSIGSISDDDLDIDL